MNLIFKVLVDGEPMTVERVRSSHTCDGCALNINGCKKPSTPRNFPACLTRKGLYMFKELNP